MPKQAENAFAKIEHNLFKSREEVALILTDQELEIKERWMLCVSKLLDDPTTPDKDLVSFLRNGCGGTCTPVSLSQAYRDLGSIYRIVGKVQTAGKDWYRHMVIEMCKKAYAKAEAAGDAKAMVMAADRIGKYTRVDQLDEEPFDYDQMIPPDLEPTDDVTVNSNLERIPDLEKEKNRLRSLFKSTAVNTEVENA